MGQLGWGRDGQYGMTVGSDTVDDWYFEYNKDGALTKELLQAANGGTPYKLGQRRVVLDKAGRRTVEYFKSENRTGYLNLDGYQVYSYDSSKKWLTKIARDSVLYGAYQYNDEDGRMTRVNFGTGPHTEYVYWESGPLSKISHYDKDGTLLASAGYEYDLAGNVTKAALDDSLTYKGDATVTYLYDAVNRLTKETCAKAAGSYRTEYDYSYWYDAVRNRTKMQTGGGTTTYLYSDRNELTKATVGGNDTLYTYDLRGNLTKKGSVEYSWDSRDKMTKVVNGNTTVEFKYDLLGRRVARRVNAGDWWWFFYDGLKVLAEGSNTSTNRVFYTLGEGAVGGILYRDRYGTKYAYHYDRLGNVMAVTDSSGAAYAVYTMDAFGNVLEKGTSTGYSSEHATDPQPYHLTTKEYDPDVGLYYFNARWYDPTVGVFVSRSPLSVSVEPPYEYAGNRPTAFLDPTGERAIKLGWFTRGSLILHIVVECTLGAAIVAMWVDCRSHCYDVNCQIRDNRKLDDLQKSKLYGDCGKECDWILEPAGVAALLCAFAFLGEVVPHCCGRM